MKLLLTTFDPGRSTKYHFAVLLAAYQPSMEMTSKPYSVCARTVCVSSHIIMFYIISFRSTHPVFDATI